MNIKHKPAHTVQLGKRPPAPGTIWPAIHRGAGGGRGILATRVRVPRRAKTAGGPTQVDPPGQLVEAQGGGGAAGSSPAAAPPHARQGGPREGGEVGEGEIKRGLQGEQQQGVQGGEGRQDTGCCGSHQPSPHHHPSQSLRTSPLSHSGRLAESSELRALRHTPLPPRRKQ